MDKIQEWCNKIKDELKKEKGKIVLLAGASSSGKSFCSDKLKAHLESSGKKVATIPADMYYKGIAKIVTQKAFLNNEDYKIYLPHANKVVRAVRNIIENDLFAEKFSEKNVSKIKSKLGEILPVDVANNLTEDIKKEFNQINFDEPFAIDFTRLTKDINKLSAGENIIIPTYSFKTGEVRLYKENTLNTNDYDYVIVEGLYTLRDELVNNITSKNLVKSAIDCDLKTLLIRRFNRDIKSDRCSYTPERTIVSFLTQVMPCYYEYIYPSLKNAHIILDTTLTKIEIDNREKSLQVKYRTTENIYAFLKELGGELKDIEYHRDYFLEDSTRDKQNNIVLRIREEKGLASKLSIKINCERGQRAVEEYDLTKDLSEKNRDIRLLLKRFMNSGYEISEIVAKKRSIYNLNEEKVKVDALDNLGNFVEFDGDTKTNNNVRRFFLAPSTKSYYELYKENVCNLIKNECERKFLITGMQEELLKHKCKKQEIKQYYLDINDDKIVTLLNKEFDNKINFNIGEARIRIIDGNKAILSIKSGGTVVKRKEGEKEIPILIAEELTKSQKSVIKTRYLLMEKKDLKAEIDFYKDRDLCIMEIEYDENIRTKQEIYALSKKLLDSKASIKDVSKDSSYKKKNLAK